MHIIKDTQDTQEDRLINSILTETLRGLNVNHNFHSLRNVWLKRQRI